MRLTATASLAALLATGCFVPVNRTSRDHLAESDARVDLAEPPDVVAARVSELFSRRGAYLVDRGASAEAVLLRYKGSRQAITTGAGSGTQGTSWVSGSTEALGSAYYVTLQPIGSGTRAWFFGRPSVQGHEPCVPQGAPFPCDGQLQSSPAAGVLLSGREEAEAIRGVILELTGLKGPATVAAAAAPPPTVAFPERPLPPPPDGFLAATALADTAVRFGPDDGAPMAAEVRRGQRLWVGTSAMRGFRTARTLEGFSGYVADGSVQVAP